MHAAAFESNMAGRPRKYGTEKTEPLSVRLPESVLDYLGKNDSDRRENLREAVFFEKELTEALEDVRQELLLSAAHQGQEYSIDRAETLARLVKLGLQAEKSKAKK